MTSLTSDLDKEKSVLYEIGLPNLVCGDIEGLWRDMFHVQVTLTLNMEVPCLVIIFLTLSCRIIKCDVWVHLIIGEC